MKPPKFVRCALLGLLTALSARADVVDDWCDALRSATRAQRSSPTRASRHIAITQLAIYEAANGIQRSYRPYLHQEVAPMGASLEAAISAAAHRVLMTLFTNVSIQTTNFAVLHQRTLEAVAEGAAKTEGLAYGEAVATSILNLRTGDGHDAQVPYVPSDVPGRWRPTPPAFAVGLDPQWPNMRPFCMSGVGHFRTHRPPALGSSAYAWEMNVVKAIGGTNSVLRTADQTEVAHFWADGVGTETPPGHWLHNAQILARSRGLSLIEKARLFALIGMGVVDAGIVSWDDKYVYDYWRPVTAIREAANDGNSETEPDPDWMPIVTTPPFPEYTSGHSTFSRTSATIIERFFGTEDLPFTAVSDGLPGVTRSFSGPGAAADESGISRIYGGIHFPSANAAGQAAGFLLGGLISEQFLLPLTAARFAQVQRAGDATELSIAVEPNRPYLIQASSDLKSWTTLTTVQVSGDTATFVDPPTDAARVRFYRAVAQ